MSKQETNIKAGIQKQWAGLRFEIKLAIIALLIILAVIVIKKIKAWLDERKRNKALEGKTLTGYTDSGKPIAINTGSIVADLWAAFHSGWFGWTEDEDRIVAIIQGVPTEYMKDVSDGFYKAYSQNLKDYCTWYLSSDQWSKIANKFTY